jgi:hypothetical protein
MKLLPKDPIDQIFHDQLSSSEMDRKFVEQEWITMRQLLEEKQERKPKMVWMYRLSSGIAAMLLLFLGWQVMLSTETKPGFRKPEVLEKSKVPICRSVKIVAENNDTLLAKNKTIHRERFKPGEQYVHSPVMKSIYTVAYLKLESSKQAVLPELAADQSAFQGDSSARVITVNINSQNEVDRIKSSIKPSFTGPRFSLSLIGAPDFNGVNSFKGSETGFNVSLQVTYHLNNRLSITTGTGYAAKPYQTAFSNYRQSNPAWWSNTFGSNLPEQVSANCRVLDIPLNLNYDLFHKGGNVFSLGAGLSSYIMLNEKYQFDFSNPADAAAELQINNQNRHFFGVINLNASYEQRITGSLGLVVQPFVKLPITQIGFGEVNLKSAGVSLGFSWNIHSLNP